MIDTDKYEGHTPAPWAYREDEVYAEGNPCIVALRAHGTDGELTSKLPHRWADFALITDAPFLLAEVKRLREKLNAKIALITDVDTMIDESWDFCITQDDWNELVNKHYGDDEE